MLTRDRSAALAILFAAGCALAAMPITSPAAAQSAPWVGNSDPLVLVPVRLAEVMDSAEARRTGITRLGDAERAALDAWLTRYSAELVRASQGMISQPHTQRGRRPSRRAQGAAVAAQTTAPVGAVVVATPSGGNYVRLADGTLWEVYLPDRVGTVTWRAGDYVTVSRAAAGVGEFDHVLVNGAARTRAFARFVELTPLRRR